MAASNSNAIEPRALAHLKPSEKPYEKRIAGNPGLILRVQPTGRKIWYYEFARHKRVKLGVYPQDTFAYARAQTLKVHERIAANEPVRPEHLRPVPKLAPSRSLNLVFADYEKQYLDQREADGFKGNGLDPLRTLLNDLGDMPLSITTVQLDAWRKKSKLNPATVNRRLTGLRSMFNWAVAEGLIATNPCVGLKPLKARKNVSRRVRVLSADEETRLRAALAGSSIEALWLLAVNTGLRQGELFQLRWADIQGDVIHVRRSKTGRSRDVPLNAEAAAALAMQSRRTALVFPGRVAGQTLNNTKKSWATVRKAAAIPHTWHESTRHTFVSRLLARGAPAWQVQKLAGHRSEEMTEYYGHLLQADARAVVDLLGAR